MVQPPLGPWSGNPWVWIPSEVMFDDDRNATFPRTKPSEKAFHTCGRVCQHVSTVQAHSKNNFMALTPSLESLHSFEKRSHARVFTPAREVASKTNGNG